MKNVVIRDEIDSSMSDMRIRILGLLGLFFCGFVENKVLQAEVVLQQPAATPLKISWPLKSGLLKSKPFEIDPYIQPTESGLVESGKFGFVRNNGTRFHKGIDLKSFSKNKLGAPEDSVFAFADGEIVYCNSDPKNSNFGKYIVIDHGSFMTLYAHLSEILKKRGTSVKAGEFFAKMGTTSNCTTIPNSRAHLHFEIDFKCGSEVDFKNWYTKKFGAKDPNLHGEYNGLNFLGVDPINFVEKVLSGKNLNDIFKEELFAIKTRVKSSKIPEFLRKYKDVVAPNFSKEQGIVAWEIEWTWYGFPKLWTPIYSDINVKEPLTLLAYRKSLVDLAKKREVLSETSGKKEVGNFIKETLKKMGFDL